MTKKLVLIPVLSTAFGAAGGVTLDAVLPMAAFGLAWGLVAAVIAPRAARWGARQPARADIVLFLAVALAFVVLGGALLGDLLSTSPPGLLDLLAHESYGPFFYAFHGPFEWLLVPALLMLNWHRPGRRRLLVGAAVAFYIGRTSSALYFAPHALDWGDDPAAADLDQVRVWIDLNWVRTVLQDTLTATLLLLAARTDVRSDMTARMARPSPAPEDVVSTGGRGASRDR
jgi:hypothetical protein